MSAATDQRAAELFKAAVGLDAAAVTAYLDAHCDDDPVLRRNVESLLHADGRAGDFLGESPGIQRDFGEAEADALVGQTIGGYRVVRRIASGGMGTVYQATQERLGRTVALKITRIGFASAAGLRRFEYETRLLARLRHSGIAQIYEAGAHVLSGGSVPFFAMEYVPNARTIVAYSQVQALPIRERLGLFIQACEAIHYGHQRGVIHRDLKPGNVLVGEDAPPTASGGRGAAFVKVIDFGVARAVDSDSTAPGLTPE